MSLTLLWAVLIHSSETYAYATAQKAQSSISDVAQDESVGSKASLTGLQQGILYLAQEGTASTLTFSLQQVATFSKAPAFGFPTDEAVPPYAARAPGDNFFCKFFYTSSQPQAP